MKEKIFHYDVLPSYKSAASSSGVGSGLAGVDASGVPAVSSGVAGVGIWVPISSGLKYPAIYNLDLFLRGRLPLVRPVGDTL